jgi:hypothetical protein
MASHDLVVSNFSKLNTFEERARNAEQNSRTLRDFLVPGEEEEEAESDAA